MKPGEKKSEVIKADDAFGPYREDERYTMPKKSFPDAAVEVGKKYRSNQDGKMYTVLKIEDSADGPVIHFDTNHEFAGRDLTFSVELIESRLATREEVAHGHVHGPGGHHHH